jgi:hypothetical protein
MSMMDLLSAPTARSTRGRVPMFRPLLDGEEFDVTFQEAAMQMGEGAHDTVLAQCTSSSLTNVDGILNSTISFYWGQAPRTELFCGYVVGVGITKSGEGSLSFGLIILGVTKVLQAGKPRFWTHKSVPSAITALAYSNNLGVHTHPHDYLWGSMAQTSQSDWQMLDIQVGRLGWSVYNRYGVIQAYDALQLFQESGSYCTLQSSQDQDFDPTAERRLIEFSPSEDSDETPDSMGTKVAYFTDRNDIQVTKQLGDHTKYKFVTDWVLRNADEATLYANAPTSKPGTWDQRATARIWGDSDIYPGMCVDVITSNNTYLRNKYDGRWLVTDVQHKMDRQSFQTQLNLARPASDTRVSQDSYRSFWSIANKPRPGLSLQDGQWVSSWTDPRVQSVL